MFKEFSLSVERTDEDTVVLKGAGREIIFPKELLPEKLKAGERLYFSLGREKFSQTVNLLDNLLSGHEENGHY